jgi:hypothetical protein
VASLFVEALARTWDVRHPAQRMALRLVALGYPLVLFPALVLLFPHRLDESFRDAALLSGRRWHDVPFLGVDLYRAFVGGLAALGVALFAMDLGSLLSALRRGRPATAAPDEATAGALEAALRPLDGAPGGRPIVHLLDRPGPACATRPSTSRAAPWRCSTPRSCGRRWPTRRPTWSARTRSGAGW